MPYSNVLVSSDRDTSIMDGVAHHDTTVAHHGWKDKVSLKSRLAAIKIAEDLLIRREQQVSLREEVLRIALVSHDHFVGNNSSNSNTIVRDSGDHHPSKYTNDRRNRISVKNAVELASMNALNHHTGLTNISNYNPCWKPNTLTKSDINHMVTTCAGILPPPVSVYGAIKELDDRAIELESFAVDIDRQRRLLQEREMAMKRMAANYEVKDTQLSTWMSNLEQALEVINAESRRTYERDKEGNQEEEELMRWTRRLQIREVHLAEKEAAFEEKRHAFHDNIHISRHTVTESPERGRSDSINSTSRKKRSDALHRGMLRSQEDLVSRSANIITTTSRASQQVHGMSDYGTTLYDDDERKISMDADTQRTYASHCGDNIIDVNPPLTIDYTSSRNGPFVSSPAVVPYRRPPPPPVQSLQ